MASSTSSCRSRLFSRVQSFRMGSNRDGLLVMATRLALSASVSSLTSLLKYFLDAVTTP